MPAGCTVQDVNNKHFTQNKAVLLRFIGTDVGSVGFYTYLLCVAPVAKDTQTMTKMTE